MHTSTHPPRSKVCHLYRPSPNPLNPLHADRFSQIVLPLVASLAEKYGTSPTPDLLEITPGFWGIMRLGVDEGSKRVAPAASNPFQNMSQDVRDWLGVRMKAAFQHVAKGWLESGDVRDPHRRPKILYREFVFPASPSLRLSSTSQALCIISRLKTVSLSPAPNRWTRSDARSSSSSSLRAAQRKRAIKVGSLGLSEPRATSGGRTTLGALRWREDWERGWGRTSGGR